MIFVAGTGSFAADVVEVARDAGHEIGGLIELVDDARIGTVVHGLPVIGIDALPSPGAAAIIGAGGDRLALAARLAAAGWSAATVVHPTAHVPTSVQLGEGTFVGPGAIFGAATVVARYVQISRGTLIGHHVRIADGVTVNPGANIGGNTLLNTGAFLGMGSVVRDHTTVGAGAVVAAGAVAVADVPPGAQVRGVPARIAGAA